MPTATLSRLKYPSSRLVYLGLFIACSVLMAVALYMEHVMALEPCPLCIMQRVMVISIGLIALVGAVHGPAKSGIQVYGILR